VSLHKIRYGIRIIGRPVIYVVIDVFSNLIVGISVSFEGPSWIGAMLALENMALDKVSFCKENGFDIEEHEWPSCGLPREILADRGELLSKNSDDLTNSLDIRMSTTAPIALIGKDASSAISGFSTRCIAAGYLGR
jgi:putative transposase